MKRILLKPTPLRQSVFMSWLHLKKCFYFLFSLCLCPLSISDADTVETINVGVAFRFAPSPTSNAEAMYDGILFAKEQFEKKNHSLKINLIRYSHERTAESVDRITRQLIHDQVKYVIGGEGSDDSLLFGDRLKNESILFITPTSSNPRVTENKPNVFRICFSDDQVAVQMAKYVLSDQKIKTIGVLHPTNNAYADYLTREFMNQYESLRDPQNQVKLTTYKYTSLGDHFKAAVEKFKSEHVDTLIAFILEADLESFFATASQEKFYPLYFGSDGWSSNETVYKLFVEKQAVKNFKAIRNAYWNEESPLPAVSEFITAFQKSRGKKPDANHAIAYDSMMVLLESLASVSNKKNMDAVKAKMKTTAFKDLVTSDHFEFNDKNSPQKILYLYEISKSGINFLRGYRNDSYNLLQNL